MVRVKADDGGYYHEPPYTPEEERDFYKAVSGGPVTVIRRLPKTEKPKPQKSPPPPRAN